MRKYNSIISILVLMLVLGACTKDSMKYYIDDVKSNESSILDLNLGPYYITTSYINDSTKGTGTAYVQMVKGADLSKLPFTISASPYASTSPASGTTINFANADSTQTVTVTAKSGKSKVWKLKIIQFKEPLDGALKVDTMGFYFFVAPKESWGWGRKEKLHGYIPEVKDEYDDTYTFTITNALNGVISGTVTHNPGPDGKYATFILAAQTDPAPPANDYSDIFRALPIASGTWVHNVGAGSITFTDSDTHKVWTTKSVAAGSNWVDLTFSNPKPYVELWGKDPYYPVLELNTTQYYWWHLKK